MATGEVLLHYILILFIDEITEIYVVYKNGLMVSLGLPSLLCFCAFSVSFLLFVPSTGIVAIIIPNFVPLEMNAGRYAFPQKLKNIKLQCL